MAAALRGVEADRLQLVRLDPRRLRFEVFHEAVEPRTVEAWRERLGAAVVVNGSFYGMDLQPQTPVRSGGRRLGPAGYRSRHGVFVSGPGAAVIDLAGRPVDAAIAGHRDALVSYPLLLAPDGRVRAAGKDTWLANRTFVATDRRGRVILDTTETGLFALERLGRFLKQAPLDLVAALNLDGGPPACLAVSAGGFVEAVYGRWELDDSTGEQVSGGARRRAGGRRPWSWRRSPGRSERPGTAGGGPVSPGPPE